MGRPTHVSFEAFFRYHLFLFSSDFDTFYSGRVQNGFCMVCELKKVAGISHSRRAPFSPHQITMKLHRGYPHTHSIFVATDFKF
jgi:hypothetical protein